MKGNKNTFLPIAHTSYGIVKDFTLCQNVNENDQEQFEALQKIAFVNVKKYANTRGWKSNPKEIEQAYKELKEILWLQIKVFNPTVIIYGNTIQHFEDYFRFSTRPFVQMPSCKYYIIDGTIHIDAYHPSYREAPLDIKKKIIAMISSLQ